MKECGGSYPSSLPVSANKNPNAQEHQVAIWLTKRQGYLKKAAIANSPTTSLVAPFLSGAGIASPWTGAKQWRMCANTVFKLTFGEFKLANWINNNELNGIERPNE
jgi:hypothetical protein